MNNTDLMFYMANKKSVLAGYILWFLVGLVGAHRFYYDRTGSAIILALCTISALVFPPVVIISLLWVFIDIFLIPGMANDYNNILINRIREKGFKCEL